MPFEPRLWSQSDELTDCSLPDALGGAAWSAEDADLPELPEDLQALGGLLSLQADRLAQQYPGRPQPTAPAAGRPSRVWRAVVACVLVGLLSSFYFWFSTADQRIAHEHSGTERPPADRVRFARDPALAVETDREPSPPQESSAIPANIFRRLSAAEQEAVLDLVDEDALAQASLSI